MKNLLITGCGGQLGSEMRRLAECHGEFAPLFTDVAELNILDREAVEQYIDRHQVDVVVNCAAYTAVDKAESQADLCDRLNREGPANLARAMARRGGQMIHISTDYVFDGTAHTPYTEEVPTCPRSVYGRTKLAGEEAVAVLCPESVIVRTAWLYSPYGGNFVKTMLRLGRERQELGVVFDQIGTPTYAADLASAIYQILHQGLVPGVYHFSNEGAISWYDFAKAIHRLAGITTCRVNPILTADYPAPAPRPHYSVLNKGKIKQTYHLDIPYWEDSLAECIDRLRAAGEL